MKFTKRELGRLSVVMVKVVGMLLWLVLVMVMMVVVTMTTCLILTMVGLAIAIVILTRLTLPVSIFGRMVLMIHRVMLI